MLHKKLLTAIVGVLGIGVGVGAGLATQAQAQTTLLGRIVITVGHSGSDYGYDSGAYGALDSGSFPGALFGDGNSRTGDEIYEDADGYWYLAYSGGTAADWNDDQEHLDEIVVDVEYQDGRDRREFVLGGFIDSRPGDRTLKLDPPIPTRDWDNKDGEEIALEFRRHRTQVTPPTLPGGITGPPATAGTFAHLMNRTPGGPVVTQMLITVIVFSATLFSSSRTTGSHRVLMCLGVLVLTPWVPAIFGYGSYILSSLLTIVVLAGGLASKVLGRPTG